jgi:hypothetical protein
VDKKTARIICIYLANGKRHDFRMYKESKIHIAPHTKAITDTGLLGLQKLHRNTEMPKKSSKKNPLTKEDKAKNRNLSRERVLNENVIGMVKRFKVISDRYRNRRRRFGLRFNLIAGIHNYELQI